MVDGTNIKELAEILKTTQNLDIDIYTHGEMLTAHSYPEINKYKHLKGHYGQGVGNSILDFSTFPGAVFVGRHSIDNIDNLYRGRIFTSDIVVPKGVSKIDDDWSPLIEAAIEARGFKKGKKLQPLELFLDKDELKNLLITTPAGGVVPLGLVADVKVELAPLSIARLMLSFGNPAALAFSMAVLKRKLPAGSGPPSLADTINSLEYF